ncbi:MAG TPA: low molecular weight protein-tyrosine-phosphatase [Steroidobacteraceae bacterium]
MSDAPRLSVLFVCMGNYCRSPTAEGVFRALVQQRAPQLSIHIDSAGTHDYHVGKAPDPRTIAAARRRGIELADLRARQVADEDFTRFDYLIAMDRDNRRELLARSPAHLRPRVRLFMEFADRPDMPEVPDPYYGGPPGFELVLDLVEEASNGLLAHLLERRSQTSR